MSDEAKDREIVDSVRASESAKGRTYMGTGLEPGWLANETMEYCKTQGWESSLKKVPNSNTWLVVSDRVIALVKGTSNEFVVKGLVRRCSPGWLYGCSYDRHHSGTRFGQTLND